MSILSRDKILKANDLPTVRVHVPEWRGYVYVRTMTGRERDEFEATMFENRGGTMISNLRNLRARLLVRTIVDDHGKPIFNRSDIAELGEKSAAALNRVYSVAQRINGLSQQDVDELVKNSEATPESDSSTG